MDGKEKEKQQDGIGARRHNPPLSFADPSSRLLQNISRLEDLTRRFKPPDFDI